MKTALITGGSRGIGLATALALAQAEYTVWICARGEAALTAACETAQEQGLTLHPLPMDVSDLKSVNHGFAQFQAQHSHLDLCVHAAGVGAFSVLTSDTDPELWHRVIQTNLNGSYYCLRAAAACLASPGRLIAIASSLGLRGMRNSHAYCASKHGLIGLVRSLAQDLAERQITVNALCPGWVDTEMGRHSMREIAEHYGIDPEMFIEAELAAVPLQRWIQPAEIAHWVLHLAADSAAAVTGQAIEISGGIS